MKAYEKLLKEIIDDECTEGFEEILEELEEEASESPFGLDLDTVEDLCLVFNDDIEHYGYFHTLLHIIEKSYSNDKEYFVKAIVKGFAKSTNCTSWASYFLNRLCNGGHTQLVKTLVNEVDEDKKVNFSEVNALK